MNTVDLHLKEKHQKDLSRQQKSSSEHSFKFWFLVVGVLVVLSAYFIQTYNHIKRREAETLERLELSKTVISELRKRNKDLDSHLRSCIAVDVALDPDTALSLSVKPQKVGVFVDYEEDLVSFYDVENRSHIYSYTDQSFTEKLYPYFSSSLNDKWKNSEPLIITPINYDQ